MRRTKKGGLWIALGVLFFLAAIGLSAFNIWDSKRAGEDVEKIAEIMRNDPAVTMETETVPEDAEEELMDLAEYEIPDYQLNPDMEMPTKQIDGKSYIGMLEIPMLELSLPIAETWSYPQLRETPCRYDGSAYKGDLIISAHNYDSHFGRLKNLPEEKKNWFKEKYEKNLEKLRKARIEYDRY